MWISTLSYYVFQCLFFTDTSSKSTPNEVPKISTKYKITRHFRINMSCVYYQIFVWRLNFEFKEDLQAIRWRYMGNCYANESCLRNLKIALCVMLRIAWQCICKYLSIGLFPKLLSPVLSADSEHEDEITRWVIGWVCCSSRLMISFYGRYFLFVFKWLILYLSTSVICICLNAMHSNGQYWLHSMSNGLLYAKLGLLRSSLCWIRFKNKIPYKSSRVFQWIAYTGFV